MIKKADIVLFILIVVFGGLIQAAGSVFALICLIKGLLSVVNGRMDRLPLIGGISLIK